MTLKFYSSLSKDLSLILNDSDDFNVIIQVGENQNIKEFRAHSVILRARSPYFKSALSANWITKKDNMIMFNKPNINPTVFDMILKYIYTGELDLTKQSGENVLELLVASDELLIEELFKQVHDYLIENQTSWIQQNFVRVLHTVFELDGYKKVQDYCLESICEDPQPLITSEAFTSLDKDILYYLLKRNDLQIEEVVAWDYLIKWGIEQTGLSSDRTKWNNENHEALKKTLSQFIPLIRFVEISHADFFDKVRPYRAVIPHDTYEEVTKFYYKKISPKTTPRVGKISSTIIKPKLATIIANWIDRNESVLLPNNKYKFNLIYSMSRDGLNNVTFYNKCNRQGPFIVLVRVQSKKIYGGYNPIGYVSKKTQWWTSTESFIFSFENDQDMNDMKISRVINANNSIYEEVNYTRFFSFGGHLYIKGQMLHVGNNNRNYNNILATATNFPIEEIEVFSIINSNLIN